MAAGRRARWRGSPIGQFLDIGSGIPTESNVHEVAQQAVPDARVAYVDIDEVAVAHSRAILFDGFELADPGLVYVPLWRPDSPADVPADPSRFQCLVGVARKP